MIEALQRDGGAMDWVLVLATYRKDAAYLTTLLLEHGISVRLCANEQELSRLLEEAPGLIVATHESLLPPILKLISHFLAAQHGWAELPIVLLLDRSASHARIRGTLEALWPRSRLTFYQRPVAVLELVSGIQSVLLARLRQRDVRDLLSREIEFRNELNHRVKNILASVSSIFEMTRRGVSSIEQLAADFRGRLGALANVHSSVFHSGGEEVPIDTVVDLTFAPYVDSSAERIVTGGPPIDISREAATTVALCLHELATNAIKYGALSCPEGKVSFRWELSPDIDPILTLEWLEEGGPRVAEPTRSGYGTRYVRAALGSLFGEQPTLTFRPEGLHYVARGPLNRALANSQINQS